VGKVSELDVHGDRGKGNGLGTKPYRRVQALINHTVGKACAGGFVAFSWCLHVVIVIVTATGYEAYVSVGV